MNQTVIKTGPGTLIFNDAITGGGGLTVAGGLFSTSGANSYSGTTTVSGGTLAFDGAGNTLSATANGAFTVNSGATLAIQPGASVTVASDLKLGSGSNGSA